MIRYGASVLRQPGSPVVKVVRPERIGTPTPPEAITVPPVRDRVALLVDIVAERTGVDASMVWGDGRMRKIAFARQVTMFVAYRSGLSSVQIARRFNRDHTTVMHAVRKIDRDRAVMPSLAMLVDQVEALA